MDDHFYTVSKLAWAVLSPSNFLILLVSIGTFLLIINRNRLAKWLLVPSAAMLMLIMIYPVGDWVIAPLEDRFERPVKLPDHIDGIIILGGAEDILRSWSRGTAEINQGGERFLQTAKLSKQFPNAPVIFTGSSGNFNLDDNGKKRFLSEYILVHMGIPIERIIIEEFSRNTHENFVFTKPLLPNAKGEYLLVTSAFHMSRSVGIARKNNIKVIAYPVDYRSLHPWHRGKRPNYFDHLNALEPAVKEWIGLTVYYWTGKTSEWFPKP